MGLRRTDQLVFFLSPVSLVKSNLHARLAFIFVFSMEQILRFVLLSITTELFKGEKKQIRRGENVADSQHVE